MLNEEMKDKNKGKKRKVFCHEGMRKGEEKRQTQEAQEAQATQSENEFSIGQSTDNQ